MTSTISLLNIGFSIVSAIILLFAYIAFFKNVNKSWLAIGSCGLLLFGLVALQYWHLEFFLADIDILLDPAYRFWLFLVPPMFYFFSRAILLPGLKTHPYLVLHFTPLLFNFINRYEIAITLIFLVGTGYSFWFANLIYSVRTQRKRFKAEMFFFGFFSLLAVLVLIMGVSVPYIDHVYFYLLYSNGIALAFILVLTALLVYPDLLGELEAVATLSYASSTLKGVNIETSLVKLDSLMREAKIYQNENLNLAILAAAMDMTGHQLSEFINVQFAMSFSRYIREQRVNQARVLLVDEPESSVLSISLETGFKSQSNFYAAFKELTQQSPGDYRKSQLK